MFNDMSVVYVHSHEDARPRMSVAARKRTRGKMRMNGNVESRPSTSGAEAALSGLRRRRRGEVVVCNTNVEHWLKALEDGS